MPAAKPNYYVQFTLGPGANDLASHTLLIPIFADSDEAAVSCGRGMFQEHKELKQNQTGFRVFRALCDEQKI